MLALAGLLLVMALGAQAVIGGGILRPLIGRIMLERAEVATYIAHEIERARDPDARAAELAEQMQVEIAVQGELPSVSARRPPKIVERRGRTIMFFNGRQTPIVTELRGREPRWVVVRFPVDLDALPRRVVVGLALLALAALAASWGISRWVLEPLEVTGAGLQRVAAGDLGHRLPESKDITGQIGQSFNRMAAQVQGLVEGQRRLMAAVSHELRTPLARMRLQAELLRDEGADPGRLDALEREIAEMDGLVEELLESARLEQGVLALRRESIDLLELAGEALGSVALGERPVRLEIPEGSSVYADRRRLLRALTNLLANAARYTPADAEIALVAAPEGEGTRLVVADRGPGVSAADLPRLFDPFFRAEGSRSRSTGGLGLGLMLVRQILEAHGGRATAAAREGGGLEVALWLPTEITAS